jgi:hypothetical protein
MNTPNPRNLPNFFFLIATLLAVIEKYIIIKSCRVLTITPIIIKIVTNGKFTCSFIILMMLQSTFPLAIKRNVIPDKKLAATNHIMASNVCDPLFYYHFQVK